jgi:hypothetical protein
MSKLNMQICEAANECIMKVCIHKKPHLEYKRTSWCKNSCKNSDGVIGSRCITMEEHIRRRAKEYFKAEDFLV